MVSIGGGKIEQELANVNIVFLQLFVGVLFVTLGLSLYLLAQLQRPFHALRGCGRQTTAKCGHVKPVTAVAAS